MQPDTVVSHSRSRKQFKVWRAGKVQEQLNNASPTVGSAQDQLTATDAGAENDRNQSADFLEPFGEVVREVRECLRTREKRSDMVQHVVQEEEIDFGMAIGGRGKEWLKLVSNSVMMVGRQEREVGRGDSRRIWPYH